jgi:hypothetical protein
VCPEAADRPRGLCAFQRDRIGVSVAFDKPSYGTGDEVRFTFKLTNNGSGRAVGLKVFADVFAPTDLVVVPDDWGVLKGSPGLTLEPGQSFELAVPGHVRDPEQTTTAVRGHVYDETGFGVGTFDSSVPITRVPGHAAGVVYGDGNGNGALDAGEQLPGATLTLRYVHGNGTYTTTSDAAGKFSFDVSAGDYTLGGEVVDGWLIPWKAVRIDPGHPGPARPRRPAAERRAAGVDGFHRGQLPARRPGAPHRDAGQLGLYPAHRHRGRVQPHR